MTQSRVFTSIKKYIPNYRLFFLFRLPIRMGIPDNASLVEEEEKGLMEFFFF
jgi:hypothetical protein